MSSQQDAQDPGSQQARPPYAPRNVGLGGTPTIVPDVPIAVVFLILYLIFGVIHIKIFKSNKGRGHKFIFNGAILGLCKIRIITMSLRIAWACYPRNVGLAIAANVFVYVGTIILYMLDWFFVQRIIRAQHTHIGWSTPYRIFHRVGLACLVIVLLMLIIGQIWQFFTLDQEKIHDFHGLFLTAQTYFTIFCLAPAVLVAISLVIPRTEVEKFGAGRLRNNIIILLVSVTILSIGQIFRCVLAWIPPTPLADVQRGTIELPRYLTKACFYCFNFGTEIMVIMIFAIVRVDLRFHVPNGSRKSGDYSRSRVNLANESVKNLHANANANAPAPSPMIHQNNSSQTLHRYQSSVFEDTQTLADSLRYPSSTLEVDEKTGNWKVKRYSAESSRSHTSISFASSSRTTLHDRNTLVDEDAPPVPEIPTNWPLPDALPARNSASVLEHTNPTPRRGKSQRNYELEDHQGKSQRTYELEGHQLNNVDVGDAVTEALTKLEMNSERKTSKTPPPQYHRKSPVQVYKPTLPAKSDTRSSRRSCKRSTIPPHDTNPSRANSTNSNAPKSSVLDEAPELPSLNLGVSRAHPMQETSHSLEIISLLNHMSGDQSTRIVDASLQREQVSSATGWDNVEDAVQERAAPPFSGLISWHGSSKYSSDGTVLSSSDARELALAQEEFRRFSSEGPPRVSSPR
ncbi:hypothetical protein EJ02DRAFT_461382 [Clathrospora elynae]|uniref:DUF3112 domain-containing protein n=1 Tax=Clathrospora elynae TaxID=706981 RepID=A0A6A5T5F2_9PLEO|nr:hypothetical protein EJ02DRAFT_461382 [Clathrospora elynae]